MLLPSAKALKKKMGGENSHPSPAETNTEELRPSGWNLPLAFMHKWANRLDPGQNHRCVYPKPQLLTRLAAWAALA